MTRMKHLTIATMLTFALAAVGSPYAAAAAQAPTNPATSSLTIPVTGTRAGGTFTGTFQLKKFVVQDGVLMASGILSGTVHPRRASWVLS